MKLGPLDVTTASHLDSVAEPEPKPLTERPGAKTIPHINLCVRLDDFVEIARGNISKQAFTYISSAADTLQSHHDNLAQWSKVTFIPRVLRDVSQIDLSTSMFGQKCALPIFIAATALVGLTHVDGEAGLAKVAAVQGLHYSPSTFTSVSHAEIAQCHRDAVKGGPANSSLFFQLYVQTSKEKTLGLIGKARELRFKGLMITVDTPCVGNRDEDRRLKAQDVLDVAAALALQPAQADNGETQERVVPGGNNGGLSRSLNWDDLEWIREAWKGPIALKGIQSAEDAKLAMQAGVEAVYLSNHGGRQLHSAPSCVATLIQIRRQCPEVLQKCEVFVDGGATRGGDVLKALCLGAKAVGIGRPLLYAMGAYGNDGVMKAIDSKSHVRYPRLICIS